MGEVESGVLYLTLHCYSKLTRWVITKVTTNQIIASAMVFMSHSLSIGITSFKDMELIIAQDLINELAGLEGQSVINGLPSCFFLAILLI